MFEIGNYRLDFIGKKGGKEKPTWIILYNALCQTLQPIVPSMSFYLNYQGMSCEGACAHAHVRCVVALVCVCAKSILKSVRDVCACGSFFGVRCAIALLHTFWNKIDRKCYFLNYSRTSYPILEHPFLL